MPGGSSARPKEAPESSRDPPAIPQWAPRDPWCVPGHPRGIPPRGPPWGPLGTHPRSTRRTPGAPRPFPRDAPDAPRSVPGYSQMFSGCLCEVLQTKPQRLLSGFITGFFSFRCHSVLRGSSRKIVVIKVDCAAKQIWTGSNSQPSGRARHGCTVSWKIVVGVVVVVPQCKAARVALKGAHEHEASWGRHGGALALCGKCVTSRLCW